MRFRLLHAALIAVLAIGALASTLALAPPASAHPPLKVVGHNTSTWLVPASARECRKILKHRPGAKDNKPGCNFKFTRTRVFYEVDYSDLLSVPTAEAGTLAAGDWQWSMNNVRITGPFSVWSVDATIFDRFDGESVWMEWQRCRWSGVGFTVTIDACPLWNDGGGRGFMYLEHGADFHVSFLVNGFPISFSHWIREDVGLTGQGFHVTHD